MKKNNISIIDSIQMRWTNAKVISTLVLLFSFVFLFTSNGNAFEVNDTLDFQSIKGGEIEFLMDKNRKFNIRNIPLDKFQPNPNNSPNFGLYNGVVWLRISLTSTQKRKLILELKNPLLDSIEIYQKTPNGYQLTEAFGDRYNFSDRPLEHRHFQLNISVPNDIIIRANNFGDLLVIPLNLSTKKGMKARDYYGQFFWGVFFGLIIVFFSINLKLLLFGKVIHSVYYLAYLFSITIVQFCFSGIGFQYFLPNAPLFTNRLLPFSGALTVLFIILFTRKFLEIKRYAKKLFRVFVIFEVTSLGIIFLQLIPTDWAYRYGVLLTNIFVLLTTILGMAAAITGIKRKFKPASYFTVGLLTQIAGAVVFILRNFGLIADNIITEFSLQISTGFFAGFITLAIIQGFKDSKMESMRNLKEMDALRENEGVQMAIEIKKQTQEIERQKEEIEEKNSEIFDSMSFAKEIQAHILPSQTDFKSSFDSSFLLFFPKELLSGDFYWHLPLAKVNGKSSFAFCIGDCTGHGVPGAMISVLALRFLSSAVLEENLYTSKEILNYVNKEFNRSFLTEENESNINDGMDCVVCTFDKETRVLSFSGAKNDINIIRNGELVNYPGERLSIGGAALTSGGRNFGQIDIQLQKGDCVYINTDGYTDQFGGPRQKKLKKQNFRNLILEHHTKSMEDQGIILTNFFQEWKKDTEQTDDVSVMGFLVE